MNDLHLQYQKDTGIQISRQVESVRNIHDSINEEVTIECDACGEMFDYVYEGVNSPDIYDYIKWLEEQIENYEKKNQYSS